MCLWNHTSFQFILKNVLKHVTILTSLFACWCRQRGINVHLFHSLNVSGRFNAQPLQTFPNICNLNLLQFKKWRKIEIITFFKHTLNFSCEGMKVQWDGGGIILLGDYTGGGVVMLWLIGSSAPEFEFQLDCHLCTHIIDCAYTE
jgi:hypothetical protein